MSGVSLHGGLERPLCEAVRRSLECLGDPKILEMLGLGDACQEKLLTGSGSSPRGRSMLSVDKDERSWRSEECFDIRHGDMEVEFALLAFSFGLAQYFITILPFLHCGMAMYLWHCMLKICDLLYDFEETLNFVLLTVSILL